MLESNRRLLEAGCALHWLHPREKRPIGDGWSSEPVLTYEQLQASYREGNNIGLRCGEPSKIDGNYLHVIDLDVRDPKLAKEAHQKMLGLVPEAASLPTVISGSGGASRHFYFVTDKPFRSLKLLKSKEKGSWEIELFGTGKQVAIPPSIHPNGKHYVWKREFKPHFIPSETVATWGAKVDDVDDLLGDDPINTIVNNQPLTDLPIEEIHDTLNDLPLPEWCEDREGWLNVGMALHHQFEGRKEGFDLWCKFSKQSKKFKLGYAEKTWESFGPKPRPFRFATLINAARVAREIEDISAFEDIPDSPPKPGEGPPRLSIRGKRLLTMNENHAIARLGGKTVALTFEGDQVDFGSIAALHEWYENRQIATERSSIPISKWWMRQPGRRSYKNVVFRPGLDVEGVLNLWRGFSVTASSEGSCQRYLDHLFENVCQRRQPDYDYLIGWLAHMVQKPWEKPGVAIVFRGEKGVGKDVVPVHLSKLFTPHYVKISQMDQLTGKFNAHMEKALLIHVEEALWAGDKRAEGPLKSLITSETVAIERKGIDVIQIENCSRVFITSNERWVVPATRGERRFAIYNVGKGHMQDRPYFRAMADELTAGGYAKLLHYLLAYDISNFDVGAAPETEGLADQKVAGLKGHEAFWQEKLDEGVMHDREHFDEGHWETNAICIPVDKLYAEYATWWETRRHYGHGAIPSSVEFGRLLSEMCPSRQRVHRGSRANRFTVHRFPSLRTCRAEFETYIGSAITWSEALTDDVGDLL